MSASGIYFCPTLFTGDDVRAKPRLWPLTLLSDTSAANPKNRHRFMRRNVETFQNLSSILPTMIEVRQSEEQQS